VLILYLYCETIGSGCETRYGWVRDEGTYFVCYSCRCLASWWIQASYSRLNLSPAWERTGRSHPTLPIGYRCATPDITDECQAKNQASFLSKVFIELQPYGHCWLGCMVKKLERHTFSQSWLCKFVLGKFARPISLPVSCIVHECGYVLNDKISIVSTRYQISGLRFVGSQTFFEGGHVSWLCGRRVLLYICSDPWLCWLQRFMKNVGVLLQGATLRAVI